MLKNKVLKQCLEMDIPIWLVEQIEKAANDAYKKVTKEKKNDKMDKHKRKTS
jgi:hypothetical protein